MANPAAGDPAFYRDTDIEILAKATSGGSAIAPGLVVHLTESTGLVASCAVGDHGRFGVIPNFEPTNADGDGTVGVATGKGSEWYVTFSNTNTVKGGQRVVADNSGKVKGYVESSVVSPPGSTDVLKALREAFLVFATYRGKDDTEGQGLDKKASDITDAVGRIRLGV